MTQFALVKAGKAVPFVYEEEAYEGVKRIAEKVAEDVEKVSGCLPACITAEHAAAGVKVFVCTAGCSPVFSKFVSEGKLKAGNLLTDREVYSLQWVEDPFAQDCEQKETILVIAGSDKRGTIYGLFHLSEMIGVSPMCYFGDAVVEKKEEIHLLQNTFFSKQPSVEYRGFFINDEWPAFGNWCLQHFGDVNAKAYDHIFELLLRMKGNYLWPAMWNSSFSEDGPGILNAQLADIYGVVMGTSHHEPLCRAGVEWQNQFASYGTDNTWDFIKNGEAISKFWEDGMRRNRSFENVVTIGMRGEADSKLLSEDATLEDNISVLKKAIIRQHDILRRFCSEDLLKVPRMLAIYKEVETYYYGDSTCEGLKDWDELKDVIFLLSDDNHGNLRAIPTEEERKHPGGFGMYYHLDYHGGPISYEWVNSTKIAKVWEQMSTAYEYGVRKMWIVNVGDLKGVEYPLNFFMDLAYDYEKYGIANPQIIAEYPEKWMRSILGSSISEDLLKKSAEVLTGYVELNAVRRPEYTNADVYHPIHFLEGQRIVERAKQLLTLADEVREALNDDQRIAFESTVYYPAKASLHLHCMNILAGYNHYLAERGVLFANKAAESARTHLHMMEQAVNDFHTFGNGKWNHMMASAHTGFRSWDDYNWTYPTFHMVEPIPCPKAIVSFRHSDRYDLGKHWQNNSFDVTDELSLGKGKRVYIDLDTRGNVGYKYEIICENEQLVFSKTCGIVSCNDEGRDSVTVTRPEEKNVSPVYVPSPTEKDMTVIKVQITYDNGDTTEAKLGITNPGICLNPYIAIDAARFSGKEDTKAGNFLVIPNRGRFKDAVKCQPFGCDFSENTERPSVTYRFFSLQEGTYEMIFELVPANPDHFGGRFSFDFALGGKEITKVYPVKETYTTEYADREWDYGVVNHVRKVKCDVKLTLGENELTIYPGEPGMMLERIIFVLKDRPIGEAYLGPTERMYDK